MASASIKAFALAATVLASGCAVIEPFPTGRYPAPRPAPIPFPLPYPVPAPLLHEFSLRVNAGPDRVTVAVEPQRSKITESTVERTPYGHAVAVTRTASDGYRTRDMHDNYEAYYSEDRGRRRPEAFRYENREHMTVDQTQERARMRRLYNSIVSKVPRTQHGSTAAVQEIRCEKQAGSNTMDCRIRWNQRW